MSSIWDLLNQNLWGGLRIHFEDLKVILMHSKFWALPVNIYV